MVIPRGYPGEWIDARELIRPDDYMVKRTVAWLKERSQASVRGMWRWVTRSIAYPPGLPLWEDLHIEARFTMGILPIPRVFAASNNVWPYPSEVLRDRMADCKGSSVLLCSLLRSILPANAVFVTVGTFDRPGKGQPFGHAWVSIPQGGRWTVLDTTLDPEKVPTHGYVFEDAAYAYQPHFRFSDRDAIRVGTGSAPRRVRGR